MDIEETETIQKCSLHDNRANIVMAVIVNTSNRIALVKSIKKEIKEKRIDTWIIDEDGDFQHFTKSQQWESAWIRPVKKVGESIEFAPVFEEGYKPSALDYGVIQGRFCEMLIGHFSDMIDNVVITPIR